MAHIRSLLSAKLLLITVLSGALAFVISVLSRDSAVKAAVPVLFLLTLVPVAHISGRTASLVVAIVAGFIFAAYLFQPYGHLAMHSAADRRDLFCFAISAMAVIHFSPSIKRRAEIPPRKCLGDNLFSSSFEALSATNTTSLLESGIAITGYAVVFMAIVTVLLYVWNLESGAECYAPLCDSCKQTDVLHVLASGPSIVISIPARGGNV